MMRSCNIYLTYMVLLFSIPQLCSSSTPGNTKDATPTSSKPNAPETRRPSSRRASVSSGGCYQGDLVCERDKLGYAAIATLHHQMDDDENGDIDLEESAEFLREELQYTGRSDHKSDHFHKNDTHITVDDLWGIWKNSSVHNWTVDQVVSWLQYDVELPQYLETFRMNAVDGNTLPRIAVNNLNFVSNILGIKNLVHKQKLANKATDVVLFGPPKSRHNWYKDVALVTALAVAIGGCWLAYRQNKELEKNMAKTMRDMDSLAKSEQALKELQNKLECEEIEKRQHIEHKERLEAKIQREVSEARLEAQQLKLTKEETEIQLSKMRETQTELERTREELAMAQKELDVRSSLSPSVELQKWLQISYELELKAYNEKKTLAEQQLLNAKESCERLRKKKQSMFGSLRMAHSGYIDETEGIIIIAKKALEEVKHDLAERQFRWQQIENMCSFSIISNPGIRALIQSTGHADIYRNCHGGSLLDVTGDMDDFEDVSPAYSAVVAGSTMGRTDSSSRLRGGQKKSMSTDHLMSRSLGDSSSRAGSEEKQSLTGNRTIHKRSSDESSTANLGNDNYGNADEELPAHTERGDNPVGDDEILTNGDNASTMQPHFTLNDVDDPDSSSSGSNQDGSSIPERNRPPLLRKSAVHTSQQHTDNISVNSDNSSSPHDEPIRSRTRTNESMPALQQYKQKHNKLRSSTLATCNNGLSNSEYALSSIKRSQTTGSTFGRPKAASTSNGSQYLNHKPDTAPASLGRTQQNQDSDASASSDSKESLTNSKRKKVKKRGHFLKFFKSKQNST